MNMEIKGLIDLIGKSSIFKPISSGVEMGIPLLNNLFISPPLRDHSNDLSKTPPIVILSAPGAVGKTMVANHIASSTDSILWDLSKIRIGDHTFLGALAETFDTEQFVGVISALHKGEIKFIFDSFDEAEIRSGVQEVKNFVVDVYNKVKYNTKPCMVFLARTETAKKISHWLDEMGGTVGTKPYWLFEIDYFDNESGFELMLRYMESLLEKDEKESERKFQITLDELNRSRGIVRDIFSVINEQISQSISLGGTVKSSGMKKFIGYAPVIQAMGMYIISISTNLSETKRIVQNVGLDGSEIISTLMMNLLLREQSKVKMAFDLRIKDKLTIDISPLPLYSPSEQLKRLGLYLNYEESCYKNEHTETHLPLEVIHLYEEVISLFLPQHPFLNDRKFAGPAFRDYVHAKLLDHDVMSIFAEESLADRNYGLTPLFYKFYIDNANLIKGEHIGYLYESITAQESFDDFYEMVITKDPVNDEHVWIDPFDESIENSISVTINEKNPLVFRQKLSRARIQIDGNIEFYGENFELADAEIYCSKLKLSCNNLYMQLSENEQINLSAEEVTTASNFRIKPVGSGKAICSWPGSDKYPWSMFDLKNEGEEKQEITFDDAFVALRGVLRWFRRDKREEYAKHHEKIKNIAVGKSRTRQKNVGFLD